MCQTSIVMISIIWTKSVHLAAETAIMTPYHAQVVTRTVPIRTWYTQDAWQHGGLKVKQEFEVKEEEQEEGPSKAKRMKRE